MQPPPGDAHGPDADRKKRRVTRPVRLGRLPVAVEGAAVKLNREVRRAPQAVDVDGPVREPNVCVALGRRQVPGVEELRKADLELAPGEASLVLRSCECAADDGDTRTVRIAIE